MPVYDDAGEKEGCGLVGGLEKVRETRGRETRRGAKWRSAI